VLTVSASLLETARIASVRRVRHFERFSLFIQTTYTACRPDHASVGHSRRTALWGNYDADPVETRNLPCSLGRWKQLYCFCVCLPRPDDWSTTRPGETLHESSKTNVDVNKISSFGVFIRLEMTARTLNDISAETLDNAQAAACSELGKNCVLNKLKTRNWCTPSVGQIENLYEGNRPMRMTRKSANETNVRCSLAHLGLLLLGLLFCSAK
jgi:hypothetical protein